MIYLLNCLYEVPYINFWIVCMKPNILPYELPLWSPIYYLMNCLHEVPYITLWIAYMKSHILPYELSTWSPIYYLMNCLYEVHYIMSTIHKKTSGHTVLTTHVFSLVIYFQKIPSSHAKPDKKKLFYYNFKICRTLYLSEAQTS